jgi:hypothetical protein
MRYIIIGFFTISLLFTACGNKTNPIYLKTKEKVK